MMGPGMFNGFHLLGKMFIALLVLLIILAPFAGWKIVELLIALWSHIHLVWK